MNQLYNDENISRIDVKCSKKILRKKLSVLHEPLTNQSRNKFHNSTTTTTKNFKL